MITSDGSGRESGLIRGVWSFNVVAITWLDEYIFVGTAVGETIWDTQHPMFVGAAQGSGLAAIASELSGILWPYSDCPPGLRCLE